MDIQLTLLTSTQDALASLFKAAPDQQLQLQPTNPEFEGSHTLVCFPLTKVSKKSPEETAKLIGEYLKSRTGVVASFNVVKGFLNVTISDSVWLKVFQDDFANTDFGQAKLCGKEIMVEYSSPNTNKPLHLGHLRNNFLGFAVASIYEAIGYRVHKVQIINDRGIHICKSMAAWLLYGNEETPKSSGLKGDHLVGKYYIEFDKNFKAQVKELTEKGIPLEEAEKKASIMIKAIDLLRKWEQRDPVTIELWKMMNSWVYEGFEVTYKRMGVNFEKLYYESDTYLLGKDEVLRGVQKGVFFKKDDGSVWVDLTGDGLDQKVLLRSDGTSVYMTQDIGTAILRFRDFPNISRQVYTVGNEQEYHFKVLFLILNKLGYSWAKECFHLSYGMVDLPSGKMKSREGTVVDADDLMQELVDEAERKTRELGKVDEMDNVELQSLFEMIGLGAIKFFLLKVDPKKRMMFDPNESVQLHGHTGLFIQYTYARAQSILRKALSMNIRLDNEFSKIIELDPLEKEVIIAIHQFPDKLTEAARDYSPAIVANYVYDLAKLYNQFYQTIPIFNETDPEKRKLRVSLSNLVARTIAKAMKILGISVPERM